MPWAEPPVRFHVGRDPVSQRMRSPYSPFYAIPAATLNDLRAARFDAEAAVHVLPISFKHVQTRMPRRKTGPKRGAARRRAQSQGNAGDGLDTAFVDALSADFLKHGASAIAKVREDDPVTYTDNDPFPAETHERGLDRVTMNAQDSAGSVDRALRFPATDLSTLSPEIPNSMLRANRYLAFDAVGTPIASAGPTGESAIPVSSFIESLLDDADAAAARTTLGLVIGTDVAPAGISGDFVGRVAAYVGISPPPGWLMLNGDTIGNISSGAIHESADYEDLFVLFWESMGPTEVVILPSRGGTAADDWMEAKTLTLPDARGRVLLGSGTGGGLTVRTHGATGGEETHRLTAAESGVPAHSHPGLQGGNLFSAEGSPSFPNTRNNFATTTGNNTAQNASVAHNNMQPWLALNYIVKY